MLSGIKKGKKKKQKTTTTTTTPAVAAVEGAPSQPARTTTTPRTTTSTKNDNLSVAEKLRQSLASGDIQALKDRSAASGGKPVDDLVGRGRIIAADHSSSSTNNNDETVLTTTAMMMTGPTSATSLTRKREEDMTINELAARERQQGQGQSWDEQMTRNLIRGGKAKKRRLGNNDDSDEEVERLTQLLPGQQQAKLENKSAQKQQAMAAKVYQREQHRLLDQHQQQEKITSKCAWWIESSRFGKHRLLALGNHVSLVMAPPNLSLQEGHHFYLVPIQHASSFVEAGEHDDAGGVWEEVKRFQTSLSNLYARQGKGIIWMETVLPHKGFWQTKLEVIPVPFDVLQDAPMYFKSAMMEQTEEWGTHNKIYHTTPQKQLPNVLPQKGFPYFAIQWGSISTSPHTGMAQIIESDQFPADYGVDTLAGMMELDPIRFKRQQKFSHDQEKEAIADFLTKWKKFDWTTDLDSNKSR